MRTTALLLAVFLGCSTQIQDPAPAELPASESAPPISGGTLLITRSGLAVAADPDTDSVWVVDISAPETSARRIALPEGSDAGRVVEDDAGRVHVVLRRRGSIAMLSLEQSAVLRETRLCEEPRGLALLAGDLVLACAEGRVVRVNASSGAVVDSREQEPDLRDVVVIGQKVFVSTFRRAGILELDESLNLVRRLFSPSSGAVAWRLIAGPGNGLVMVHQLEHPDDVDLAGPNQYAPGPSAIGSRCGQLVGAGITVYADPTGSAESLNTTPLPGPVLPVDVALLDTAGIAVASPGDSLLYEWQTDWLGHGCPESLIASTLSGQPVAVAAAAGAIVVQTRNPGGISVPSGGISVTSEERKWRFAVQRRANFGHALFHRATRASISCASCHPEGGDDGLAWRFNRAKRRTQSLRGGILGTAPFHWTGEFRSFGALLNDVLVDRMQGQSVSTEESDQLANWLDALPAPAPAHPKGDRWQRGKLLFESAETGCASCHSGPKLTNNSSVDVGTGGRFQVPSLVGLSRRAPYMHDGCAGTLLLRFTDTRCGGGDRHGRTGELSAEQLADLVAYLETL